MIKYCLVCSKDFYTKPARIKIGKGKYCSRKCKGVASRGKHLSKKTEFKRGNPPPKHKTECNCGRCTGIAWNKGTKRWWDSPTEFKKGQLAGKKHFNWKGGITPKSIRIRKSKEFAIWRVAVFTRDDYACQKCGQRGGTLHADHIKPFALYPELRFAIDNGQTLCVECHSIKTRKDWNKYNLFNSFVS